MSKTLEQHNYHSIDATVIADSKNEHGQRIISFVCTFPRIVLAEFNTHRMLSRNSASSRAIPFERMLKDIEEHPFIPIKWMKDHKGMQGNEYFTDSDKIANRNGRFPAPYMLKKQWLKAKDSAILRAKELSKDGLTKQIVNRLLEPFKWHTVIVTATEWENFFALRADDAAEIHIQDLAFKMLEEYNNSEPKQLKAGEWHIPFGDNIDNATLGNILYPNIPLPHNIIDYDKEKVKIATARCARVSYENFDGSDDYQKDIGLHDRLASMGHMSPMEHCARSMSLSEYEYSIRGNVSDIGAEQTSNEQGRFEEVDISDEILGWSKNFRGFVQYRSLFENENRSDPRIK